MKVVIAAAERVPVLRAGIAESAARADNSDRHFANAWVRTWCGATNARTSDAVR
jgi:hypothetical protein